MIETQLSGTDNKKSGRIFFPVSWALSALLATAVVGIGLSLFIFSTFRAWEDDRCLEEFEAIVVRGNLQIEQEAATLYEVFYSLGSVATLLPEMTRHEFERAARPSIMRHPSIKALEWIPRVSGHQRSEYENLAKKDGLTHFEFKEIGPGGQVTAAGLRDEYYPVFFVTPMDGNEAALGLDLYASPPRKKALDMAIASGGLIMSEPITLVQEEESQKSVLVFLPVFNSQVAQGQNSVRGVILAVIRVADLIDSAQQKYREMAKHIEFEYSDQTPGEAPVVLYTQRAEANEAGITAMAVKKKLRGTPSRVWGVSAAPTESFLKHRRSLQPFFICAVSLFLTVVVVIIGAVLLNRNKAVANLVRIRTQALKDSESRANAIVETAFSGIITMTTDGIIKSVNPAGERLFGYTASEIIDGPIVRLMPEPYHSEHPGYLKRYLETGVPHVIGVGGREVRGLRKNGAEFDLELAVSEMQTGDTRMFMGIVTDITARKEAEEQLMLANLELKRLASIDGLTGIANRRQFDQHFENEWRRAIRSSGLLAVMMVDVDYFKRFNDHYGHQVGDACLREVACALSGIPQRAGDLVARYGGEEFVLLFPAADGQDVMALAEKSRESISGLSIPHAESDVSDVVTTSIGVASIRPVLGQSRDVLIQRADQALYDAKKTGRNRVVCWAQKNDSEEAGQL